MIYIGDFLQIFNLLAFLAIGLISITVPTYAISVSYLARETITAQEIMKRRREELQKKLEEYKSRLAASPDTKELKDGIKNYERQIKEIKTNLFDLYARSAVWRPIFFFLVALIFSAIGSYDSTSSDAGAILYMAVVSISFGLVSLGRSLRGIERAALRETVPKFEVKFGSGVTSEKFKVREQKLLSFSIKNIGEELAENVRLMIFFPPNFLIKKGYYDNIVTQGDEADYPKYKAVFFFLTPPYYIYADDVFYFHVLLRMPEQTGKYEIPIEISARNMKKSDHRLTIEVVNKSKK